MKNKMDEAAEASSGSNGNDLAESVKEAFQNREQEIPALLEGDDDLKLSTAVPRLERRRWLILAAYCLLSTSNLSSWCAASSISNIMQKFYDKDLVAVNWIAMSYSLISVVLMFPFSHLMHEKGLSTLMVAAGFFNAIGSSVKYIGSSNSDYGYWFFLGGSLFCAAAGAAFIFLPAKIAALWFGEKERATATSIAIAADSFGLALGYIQPPAMIKNSENKDAVASDLARYLLVATSQAIISFIFICIVIRDKPSFPANDNEASKLNTEEMDSGIVEDRERGHIEMLNEGDYRPIDAEDSTRDSTAISADETEDKSKLSSYTQHYRALLKNKSYQIVLHVHGLLFSTETVWLVVLNEILIPRFPGYEVEIGSLGSVGLILSVFTNFLIGILIDKTRAYRRITIILTSTTFILVGCFTILFNFSNNFMVFYVVYVSATGIFTTYYTIAFDHGAELTYPISEAHSGVLLLWVAQLYSLIFAEIASLIIYHISSQCLLYFLLGMYFVIFFLSLWCKNRGSRTAHENRQAFEFTQMTSID